MSFSNKKTEALLNSVKRRAMLPDSDSTFSDTDIIDMLNEEVTYFAIPHLLETNEEFLVYYEDVTLVEGQTNYEIPYRSVSNKLRDAYIIDSSGDLHELTRIGVEDIEEYQNTYNYDYDFQPFHLQNNELVFLTNTFSVGVTLRMYFYLKPNKLVKEKRVGTITAIDTDTGVVTLTGTFPTNFSSDVKYDFISQKIPNKVYTYDILAGTVDPVTKTITFTADDLPSNLAVGDFVALAGETHVLPFPETFNDILAQRVAVQALESLNDEQAKQSAERRLEKMEKATTGLMNNRVEGAVIKLNGRNTPLKSGKRRRRKF